MAIPKNIIQTFKTDRLPWITRYHVNRLKRQNPRWKYQFYDDNGVVDFFRREFSAEYVDAFNSLTVGAAKADFFRYAVLYKRGGVYLDIDAFGRVPLDRFILDSDEAIVSNERYPGFYSQWALIYNREHPFLKRVLEKVLDNIQTHRFPNDVHQTTGPTVYTQAVNEVLKENPQVPHRLWGVDYDGNLKPKYKLARISLYGSRDSHWKRLQHRQDIIQAKPQGRTPAA